MSYLFFIDDNNNTVLHPDALKLCEELRVLDDKEIALIIYACDYHSPFRQFTDKDRRRKAMVKVYGSDKKDLFEPLKIKNAVEAYMSLQYNPKVELVNTYNLKIDELQKELMTQADEKSINRILKSVDMLRKSVRELEAEVYEELIKEGRVVGNASLSLLENMQKNKDAYKNIMRKPKK